MVGYSNAPDPALFLFDVDWTLLPSSPVHQAAFPYAFHEVYGMQADLVGMKLAGRTDTWILWEALRRHGLSDEEIQQGIPAAFAAMERYVEEHLGDLRGQVLPGVREMLAGLHGAGAVLGLLTGNLAGIAAIKMRRAGLAEYLDTGGFGEESDTRAHLVPVAIQKASATVGMVIPPERTVVIGDTPHDVEAGHANETLAAGVATGPFSVEQLRDAGAELVLPSFADAEGAVDALLRLAGMARD